MKPSTMIIEYTCSYTNRITNCDFIIIYIKTYVMIVENMTVIDQDLFQKLNVKYEQRGCITKKCTEKEVEKCSDKNTTITLIKHPKNLPNNLSILSSHFQIKIYNAESSKTEKVSDKRKRKRSFYTTVWKECKSDEIIPEMKCMNQVKKV